MFVQRILWVGIPIALVGVGIAIARDRAERDQPRGGLPFVSFQSDDHSTEVVDYVPPSPERAFVRLTGLGDEEAVSAGFTLNQPMDVHVYALGEGMGDEMYDYGWIVETATRRAVWRMNYATTMAAGGASKNRMTNEVVSLQPGSYEVFFVTDGSHSSEDWNATPPMHESGWGITLLRPDGVEASEVEPYNRANDPAIIAQLTRIGDGQRHSQHFTLDAVTDVRVYAIGEGSGGEMYDYAWIEDVAAGRAVWEMTYRTTEHAGGARKNRLFNGGLVLPSGSYILHYETDGSHSAEEWNAEAPDDPFSWGVTLYRD